MQSRDEKGKSFGVITSGAGTSACTFFTNGARVSCGNGKVTYTAPDGKKTVQDGYSYTTSKVYKDNGNGIDEDSKDYDVVVKVYR